MIARQTMTSLPATLLTGLISLVGVTTRGGPEVFRATYGTSYDVRHTSDSPAQVEKMKDPAPAGFFFGRRRRILLAVSTIDASEPF